MTEVLVTMSDALGVATPSGPRGQRVLHAVVNQRFRVLTYTVQSPKVKTFRCVSVSAHGTLCSKPAGHRGVHHGRANPATKGWDESWR